MDGELVGSLMVVDAYPPKLTGPISVVIGPHVSPFMIQGRSRHFLFPLPAHLLTGGVDHNERSR